MAVPPRKPAKEKRPSAVDFFSGETLPAEVVAEQSMAEKTKDELLLTVTEVLKKGRAEDAFETEVVKLLKQRMLNGDVEEMPTFALVKLYEIIKKSKGDFTDSVLNAIKASAEKPAGAAAGSKLLEGRRLFLKGNNGEEQSFSKDQVQSANSILKVLEKLTGAEIPEDIKDQLDSMSSQLEGED